MDRYNSLPEEAAVPIVRTQPFHSAQSRILIVDDFESVRDGLRSYIDAEPDMMLVGEADCGCVALEALHALEISAQREVSEWEVSEWEVSEWEVSEWEVSEWEVSEWEVSEWEVSEWEVSEWKVSEWEVSEWEVSEKLLSASPASSATVDCGVDVVVLDMSLPDSIANHVCAKIRGRWPMTQVLALAVNEDRGSLHDALASGALGYVLKRSSSDEIIRAIRDVGSGQAYIDPLLSSMIAGALIRGSRNSGGRFIESAECGNQELSWREEQILRFVVEGISQKEIAAMLNISVKSVQTYKARSMSKRNLRSRAEIVRYGSAKGWLTDL